LRAIVMLAAMVVTTLTGVTPASAAPAPLVSAASGRCLNVTGNADTPGTTLELQDCTGQAGQAYEFTAAGELRTMNGGRCVDAYGNRTAPGTAVIIWPCTGGANQQWRQNADGTITGTQSGLCLDASGAGTANGTPVILWTCHGQSNQRWSAGTTPPTSSGTAPCDIYASGGTPCIAAHSTVRALYGAYAGSLYQVRRSSDTTTRNIGVLTAGGAADAAAQDSFCAGTSCVVTVVYDQSGRGNDLWHQGSSAVPGSSQSSPAKATSESLTVGGAKAYSLFTTPATATGATAT
jgi:hypothetical protein